MFKKIKKNPTINLSQEINLIQDTYVEKNEIAVKTKEK